MANSVAWGIDIGKSSLKAVKIRNFKGDLEIEAVHYYEYEPNQDSESASKDALERFVADAGGVKQLKKDSVAVALPGQMAFSRFLELPPVDEKRIDETIALEAKQQIPFPIDQVNWGYHKIQRDYAPGEQHEVGIFAIKKDMVQDFVGSLKAIGIEPELLTISPLALYNFASYDCKTDGGTILLDIGADQTNLVLIDGERLWIRNLPIAGNEITKSLKDKFNIPFDEAEKLKKNAKKSSNAKKIFTVMQPVLKDFLSEIQRSLSFYKSKQREAQFSRILMTGNGTKLINLSTFLGQELADYKIRRITQLNNLRIDTEVDMKLVENQFPSLSIAFGLAIQAVGAAKANVNLLPQEVVQSKAIRSKAPLIFAGAGLMLLGSIASFFISSSRLDGYDQTVKDKLESKKFKAVVEAEKELGDVLDRLDAPVKSIGELNAIFNERLWPAEIAEKLAPVLPDGSALPWRDPAGDRVKLPPELPQDKPQAAVLMASAEMAKFNAEKTWVLGMDWERKQVAGTRYYQVKLAVARAMTESELVMLTRIKNDLGAKIQSAFQIPSADLIQTTAKNLEILDRTSTLAGSKYYMVEFSWGYPVEAWMHATKPVQN